MKKHFLHLLILSVILVTGCQKEMSFETGGTLGEGTLTSDASGDCLPKTVNGTFTVAVPLSANTNTLTVEVNVTKTGAYTIYTDTVNGYYFRAGGTFTSLGANTVTVRGNGTPFTAGTNNFVVHYNNSVCDLAVTVGPAGGGNPAVFTLETTAGNCTGATVNGTYAVGSALNATHTVSISVNVTTIGTYSITTTFQGMTFAKSGTFTATGVQSVVLVGSGNPTTAGNNVVPITVGASTCNFTVNVGNLATGTLGGGPGACTPVVKVGTYTVGTPLAAGNTVQIQLTAATAGVYNITTNTVTGFSFSGSGNAVIGANTVTLTGTGNPTTAGVQSFTVTFGTSSCTFTITVAAGSGAVGSLGGGPGACTPAVIAGTYTVGTALTAGNTVQVQINATTAGAYNITTNTVTGFSFAATGTAVIGPNTITLIGSGSPTTAGPQSFTVTFGTSLCNFTINVVAAGGGAAWTPDCSSAVPDGLYEATTQLNASNTVEIDVNVTAIGPYSIATTPINGMTFSASGTFAALGNTTITLVGSGTPTIAGTFNVSVPGTPSCTFPLDVDPAPTIDWKFTVTNAPATTYQGQTDDAQLQAVGPGVLFTLLGSNSLGSDQLVIALNDANGTIANGEVYTSTSNALFSYDLATGTDSYTADPTVIGVTMTFTVTTHTVATKTIVGTFTGTAKNMAGQTITVTNGTFKGTYP